MNRKSIICAILALTLILTGTGYAFWTDTLNITTKATTGDFDVTFVDFGLYAQYVNEEESGFWSIVDGIGEKGFTASNYFLRGQNYRMDYVNEIAMPGTIDQYYKASEGYNSVKFDAELVDATPIDKTVGPYIEGKVNGSDNILITVENMYPGYAQALRSDILNIGSIAAKLSSVNFTVTDFSNTMVANDTAKDMLGIAFLVGREYMATPDEEVHVFELAKAMGLSDDMYFQVGGVDFVRLSALDGISKEILADYSTILALPSENRMDIFIGVAMDPDAEGVYTSGSTKVMSGMDDTLSQGAGAQISIDMLWDQFNEGITIDSTNILSGQNH